MFSGDAAWHEQVDIARVVGRVDALKAPASGPPHPVTKLWPRHIGGDAAKQQPGRRSRASGDSLKAQFPDFFRVYGYQ